MKRAVTRVLYLKKKDKFFFFLEETEYQILGRLVRQLVSYMNIGVHCGTELYLWRKSYMVSTWNMMINIREVGNSSTNMVIVMEVQKDFITISTLKFLSFSSRSWSFHHLHLDLKFSSLSSWYWSSLFFKGLINPKVPSLVLECQIGTRF